MANNSIPSDTLATSDGFQYTSLPSRLSSSVPSISADEEFTPETAPLIASIQSLDLATDFEGRKQRVETGVRGVRCGGEGCEKTCCRRLRRMKRAVAEGSDCIEMHDVIGEREAATITCLCINKACNTDQTHCHGREVKGNVDRKAKRKLRIAIGLVVVFMTAEALGGYFAHSLAIMTDAAHMLSDFASFVISLSSMWLAGRKPTKKMSFGFHRAEIVGALGSVLIIWILAGVLMYEAIVRILQNEFDINANVMLVIAGLGVMVNVIIGFVLKPPHGHGHGHSHGHSHDHNGHHAAESLNVRAAFVHVVGDLIFSLGLVIAAFIIKFKPEWSIVDPICTFIFSVLVLGTTYTVVRDGLHILMEGTPKELSFDAIRNDLLGIYGVMKVHNMHIWSLTTDKTALDVHLAIEPKFHSQDVLDAATELLVQKYRFYKTTIQVETYRDTMETCVRCEDLT